MFEDLSTLLFSSMIDRLYQPVSRDHATSSTSTLRFSTILRVFPIQSIKKISSRAYTMKIDKDNKQARILFEFQANQPEA